MLVQFIVMLTHDDVDALEKSSDDFASSARSDNNYHFSRMVTCDT